MSDAAGGKEGKRSWDGIGEPFRKTQENGRRPSVLEYLKIQGNKGWEDGGGEKGEGGCTSRAQNDSIQLKMVVVGSWGNPTRRAKKRQEERMPQGAGGGDEGDGERAFWDLYYYIKYGGAGRCPKGGADIRCISENGKAPRSRLFPLRTYLSAEDFKRRPQARKGKKNRVPWVNAWPPGSTAVKAEKDDKKQRP